MNKILNGTVVSMTLAVGLAVGGCGLFNDNQPRRLAPPLAVPPPAASPAAAVSVAAGSTAATPSAVPGTWVIPSTAE